MTGFAIGMLAAGMWLGVMAAVWFLFKNAPGHPFRSIGRFRATRKRLGSQVKADPKSEAIEMPLTNHTTTPDFPEGLQAGTSAQHEPAALEPSLSQDEPGAFIDLASIEVPASIDVPASIAQLAEGVDPGKESVEMDALIGAVTAPKKPRKPRPPVAKPRGPQKVGRTTYLLVDDEGRPLV